MSRPSFLDQAAPANYVAGIGRGATGFTTRSDLGPTRTGASDEQMKEHLAQRAKEIGLAPPTAYGISKKKQDEDENEDEERFKNADDEGGLLALGSFDQEDDEADRIYQSVDERLEKRRKHIRERREQKEQEEFDRANPKVSVQFAPLKQGLAEMSTEDWANLPEAGDYTGKNKRNRQNARGERFYAVPDSVLAGARDLGATGNSIQDEGGASTIGNDGNDEGTAGVGVADGTATAAARGLSVRLDATDKGRATSGTATSVDSKGYLTSLGSNEMSESFDIGNIKRSRMLLESVIKANPYHAPGWVAAARLEDIAGKQVAARNVIKRGCELCPKSEEMWLYNIRLHEENPASAKVIAAKALEHNEHSVKIWMRAVELENFAAGKKRVVRRALDFLPKSVEIWMEAVNLEETKEDARMLLTKAVELAPLSVELWLTLANLEKDVKRSEAVINKARKTIPTSHEIWCAGARLQEKQGNLKKAFSLMSYGVTQLSKAGSLVRREQFIEQAMEAERDGNPVTCEAIIQAAIGWGLQEDDDRMETWLEDGRIATNEGRHHTARAIYKQTCREFKGKVEAWLAAADLEAAHGTPQQRLEVLEAATESIPNSRILWTTRAKEHFKTGDAETASMVLREAFTINQGDEVITSQLVALEIEAENFDIARQILSGARAQNPTDRMYIKSAAFERQIGDTARSFELIAQGIRLHPKQPKFYMMRGQLYESQNMTPQAKEAYQTGVRVCPNSVPLWLLLARLEERQGTIVRARSILDRARLANKKNDTLWLESVRLERRAKLEPAARQKMAQAQQECPNSGILWAERIWHLETRTKRRPRAIEALKNNENDPVLYVTMARLFEMDRKIDRADTWYEKATKVDPRLGDAWAWWWKFLQQYGTEEKKAGVLEMMKEAEPRHGETWAKVAKRPENAAKGLEKVLELVVQELK